MIHKPFFIVTNIALAVLIALGSFPVRAAAQGLNTKLSINEIELGSATNPLNFRQVSWSLTGLDSSTRIEGYELMGALSQAAPAPTQKPKRDLDAIRQREGLKKKERIVVRPLPPPQPNPTKRPRSKSNTR